MYLGKLIDISGRLVGTNMRVNVKVRIRPKNEMNGNHFSDVFDKFHIDLILETNENSFALELN